MTSPSTCRACLRDQHHRCVGWCGCPFAHNTTRTPAPRAERKPRTPATPRAPRTRQTAPVPAPAVSVEAAPAKPAKRFKPRHRRPTTALSPTTRRETALAFLDVNAWNPAALQLLAAVDGEGPAKATESAA